MTYQRFPQTNRNTNTTHGGPQLYTETEAVGEPTEEDIEEFARRIGIDTKTERHLLYLARDGLNEKLPPGWKPCKDSHRDAWYYYNNTTHMSQWEHPMDAIYRDKVIQARADHAMNRIQNFDISTAKPLMKSLPPLKKAGGGVNSFPSTLGPKLGPLRNSSFSSSEDLSQFSTSLQKTNPSSSALQPLEPLIKKSPLGGLSSLNSNTNANSSGNNGNQTFDHDLSNPRATRIRMDTTNPSHSLNNNSSSNSNNNMNTVNNTQIAPLKKSGLTLTGTGANFLKSAKTSGSSADLKIERTEEVATSQLTAPLKPIPEQQNIAITAKAELHTTNSNLTSGYNNSQNNNSNKLRMVPSPEEEEEEDEEEDEEESNFFQPQKPDETTSMTTNQETSLSDNSTGRPLKSILVKNSLKSRSRLDENSSSLAPTKRNLWDINPNEMTAEENNQWNSLDFSSKRKPSVKFQLEDPKLHFDISNRESDDQEETEGTTDDDSEEDLEDESEQKEEAKQIPSKTATTTIAAPKTITTAAAFTTSVSATPQSVVDNSKMSAPIVRVPMDKPLSSGDGKFVMMQENQEQGNKFLGSISKTPEIKIQNKPTFESTNKCDQVVDRQTIKANMENQLKEYQSKMEEDGKRQQEQIKTNMEEQIALFKSEMASIISRTKEEFETNKKVEVDKARSEMETTLMNDLEKLRKEYKEKLDKKKQELTTAHEAALKAEAEQVSSTKNNSAKLAAAGLEFEKKLTEQIDQLKATMTEQHNKQVDEMKAHHKATIQQLKKEFQAEEEKLKKDHSDIIVEMLSKFDAEKQALLRSFEIEQDKIKEEFSLKAAQLTEELNQNLESVKKYFEEKSKQYTVAVPPPPAAASSPSHASVSGTSAESLAQRQSQTTKVKQAEEELVQLKLKYKTLEDKYLNLKRGIHNVVVNEKAKISEKNYYLENDASALEALQSRSNHPNEHQLEDANNTNTNETNSNNTVDSGAAESEDTSASVSEFGNPKNSSDQYPDDEANGDKTIHKIMSGSNDRLNQALTALEDLKKQILDIKAEQRKIGQVEFSAGEILNEDIHVIHPRREKTSKDSNRHHHHNNNSSNNNSGRTIVSQTSSTRVPRAHVSRSVLEANSMTMPAQKSGSKNRGLLNNHHHSSSMKDLSNERNYVDEAKDFIKSQKYRLKRPGLSFGSPVSTSIGAKQRHEYKIQSSQNSKSNSNNNNNNNNGNFVMESNPNGNETQPLTSTSLHQQLLARSKAHSHSLDHFSETESSGVGSWKETKSEEKSKIGQDIEGILTSLQQLDGQMKYLWSVVGGSGANSQSASAPSIVAPSATPLITSAQLLQPPSLNNAVTSSSPQLFKSSNLVNPHNLHNHSHHPQNVKNFGPTFKEPINISELALKYNLAPSLVTPGNQALINSINVVNSAQFRRSMDIATNPATELTQTLEEHVNNIRNRQSRIIREYPTEKRARSPSISEKTKDLREWLEKF